MRLLVVETVASCRYSQLCDDRNFVIHADSPDEAMSILRHETFDVVILDLTSLSSGGFAFIRQLRTARNDTPLVALTGCNAGDRVRALGLGADDAIAQPVDTGELRARIAAVVRRYKGHSQSLVQIGDLSLSLGSCEVRFRNKLVHLTAREYSILEILALRMGQVVTKDMFLSYLYGGMDEPEIKIIDVFICKLRNRLKVVGADCMIVTVWGQGYTIEKLATESRATVRRSRQPRPAAYGRERDRSST